MMRVLITASALLVASLLHPAPASAQDAPSLFAESYRLELKGKYRDALTALEKVAGEPRKGYIFTLRRAWLRYLNKRYAESLTSYQAATQKAPKAVEPLLGLMLPQMALRRWLDVTKTAQRVLKRDPGNYKARSTLAWALYSLGRFGDAAKQYRAVLDDYPSDLEMQAGLGWSLYKLGRKVDAAKAFVAVLAIAPAHASAKQGLALTGGSAP